MFKNFFKRQDAPKESREIETAVVLTLYADGGPTIPILKVDGIKQRRPATMNDLYRMACDIKNLVEEVGTSDRVMHSLMQSHPQNQPPQKPVVKSEVVNESVQKVEEKK